MGDDDLVVKAKLHRRDDYRPYVTIPIEDLDPNNTVPDWNTVSKDKNVANNEKTTNNSDQRKGNKRGASNSPEDARTRKRMNGEEIDDWQVAEFLFAFLEGTATRPKYENLDWNTVANREENNFLEEAVAKPEEAKESSSEDERDD